MGRRDASVQTRFFAVVHSDLRVHVNQDIVQLNPGLAVTSHSSQGFTAERVGARFLGPKSSFGSIFRPPAPQWFARDRH